MSGIIVAIGAHSYSGPSPYRNLLFTENNGSDRQRKQIWTTN